MFNPMVMSEMRRMLRAGAAENGQSAAVLGPDGAALARVKRNLFGAVDHEETKRFVESELAAQQRRDADMYEFDFVRGVPCPNSKRYSWEKVRQVPESYALRRMPYLRRHTDVASATVVSETSNAVATVQESTSKGHVKQDMSSTSESTPVITKPTKQSSICDFMKSRKRPSNSSTTAAAAAKLSLTEPTSVKQVKKSHS